MSRALKPTELPTTELILIYNSIFLRFNQKLNFLILNTQSNSYIFCNYKNNL